MYLAHYFEKRLARKAGIKINDLRNLKKSAEIYLETPVSLGDTEISLENNRGNTLKIGRHSYIRSGDIQNTKTIGRYCSIGQQVLLGVDRRTHPVNWASTSLEVCENYSAVHAPLVIGHDVWIGHNTVIMSDVKIGNGAIIGCNSLVLKDVEPYQIVAGNPARHIRYRFDTETVTRLNNSEWWQYPVADLRTCTPENIDDFLARVQTLEKLDDPEIILIHNRKIRKSSQPLSF